MSLQLLPEYTVKHGTFRGSILIHFLLSNNYILTSAIINLFLCMITLYFLFILDIILVPALAVDVAEVVFVSVVFPCGFFIALNRSVLYNDKRAF